MNIHNLLLLAKGGFRCCDSSRFAIRLRARRRSPTAIDASGFDVTELVVGGAPGVDAEADEWAREHDIPIMTFRADWKMGKAAGPFRNRKMAEYAAEDPAGGALVALYGGDGTRDMIRQAVKRGLRVYLAPNGPGGLPMNPESLNGGSARSGLRSTTDV